MDYTPRVPSGRVRSGSGYGDNCIRRSPQNRIKTTCPALPAHESKNKRFRETSVWSSILSFERLSFSFILLFVGRVRHRSAIFVRYKLGRQELAIGVSGPRDVLKVFFKRTPWFP